MSIYAKQQINVIASGPPRRRQRLLHSFAGDGQARLIEVHQHHAQLLQSDKAVDQQEENDKH
jgi:hypothetical protein